MKIIYKIIPNLSKFFCSALLIAAFSTSAFADGHGDKAEPATKVESSDQAFDLSELTCWDVMTLEEAERGTVLFLYYGYVSGVKGELVHDGATISKLLTQLGEHCSDNPDDNVLTLMTKSN